MTYKLHLQRQNFISFNLFSAPEISNPCNPSPCGPNSQCREINQQSVCSCIPGYIGQPPTCRPECIISSDCISTEACTNQKCRNPCIGTCGVAAQCQVLNHNPICSCPEYYTGNPFIRCYPKRNIIKFNMINNHKAWCFYIIILFTF